MSGENDLLERATRALRATPPPSDDELLLARQRLLAAQRSAKSSRARTLRWVLPLAAMLAAGSAFAAVPGSFERVAQAVTALLAPRPVADHKARHKARPARVAPAEAPRPAPAPAPIPTPAVVDDLPSTVSEPPVRQALATAEDDAESRRLRDERRRRREERARGASAAAPSASESPAVTPDAPALVEPAPAPVAPEPAHDKDLALYRYAHEKHFRARDFAAALRGWDQYLQAYPSGTFAVEARYNRAICLVRLDRKDEARRALLPFARGEVARGYRQAEATKLLKALE